MGHLITYPLVFTISTFILFFYVVSCDKAAISISSFQFIGPPPLSVCIFRSPVNVFTHTHTAYKTLHAQLILERCPPRYLLMWSRCFQANYIGTHIISRDKSVGTDCYLFDAPSFDVTWIIISIETIEAHGQKFFSIIKHRIGLLLYLWNSFEEPCVLNYTIE